MFGLLPWHKYSVCEGDKDIMVNVELPGMQPGDIDIRVDERRLTISGEKKMEKEEKRSDIHKIEMPKKKISARKSIPVKTA